ncbi:hypothetical protein [Burkholderia cenocepacia]|uniref:hypothetical protein n=1 Tax=Burkholderia cenocepacia TaxID=95486 RepID=UPI0022305698|nr:hypothetical protein [Burkholderia cenocepacia]MCW3498728.1 hypothetical protein [Burkholderia cenocepacia]MCW3506184.1 hypothetical protein [Burkholderia cenocepacia]MCW3513881.1 hypothetical protein [Burkholderia cenocepacia]MCW3529031.1 hypothetical protein [Burkholderia cenocepacia]MCW3544635.1 hypothetical protein [Burkholderia cenocepacia]
MKANSTIPQLKSFVFDGMIEAATKYDSKDSFMDNFNDEYNQIDYVFTAKLLNDFYDSKHDKYRPLFERDWYSLDTINDERQKKTLLLDYMLNDFAWSNFEDIWQSRK